MKYYCLTFIFLATIGFLSAQTVPYLDTPTVSPATPSSIQDVTIITKATTPNSGFKISSTYTVDHTQKKIFLESCYWGGMLTALKTYVDTFNLGQLQGGVYSINFKASISNATVCAAVNSNSVAASVSVTALATSFKEAEQNKTLSVFPNPVKDKLRIVGLSQLAKVDVFAANGLLIEQLAIEPTEQLDVSDLNDGVYLVRLALGGSTSTLRFVKISK